MNLPQPVEDILQDLNTRYPGPAVMTINQMADFLGFDRRTAIEIASKIGKKAGRQWDHT